MIITFFRSSLLTTWEWCQLKTLLEYSYGFHFPSNQKAELGSIVHQTLELLAHIKLAEQNGLSSFYHEELNREFKVNIGISELLPISYNFYKDQSAHTYTDAEYKTCQIWIDYALTYKKASFNPLNREILSPEQYFYFPINKKWANYDYEVNNQKIEGQLKLRGSMDLITQLNQETLEYVDYKTGKIYDWGKEKEKTSLGMKDDIQLRLYHYALKKLYPQFKYYILTLFYIAHQRDFPVCFDDEDIIETEKILEEKFNKIRRSQKPIANLGWRCRFCPFGNKNFDENNTYCKHFQKEIKQIGLDKMNEKYYNHERASQYTGGGKTIDGTGFGISS